MSFANFGEPVTLVRSPILIKGMMGLAVKDSSPLSRRVFVRAGIRRGGKLRTASAMTLM